MEADDLVWQPLKGAVERGRRRNGNLEMDKQMEDNQKTCAEE